MSIHHLSGRCILSATSNSVTVPRKAADAVTPGATAARVHSSLPCRDYPNGVTCYSWPASVTFLPISPV